MHLIEIQDDMSRGFCQAKVAVAEWGFGLTMGWRTRTYRYEDASVPCSDFDRWSRCKKFASVHASFHNHFSTERHLIDRETYKPAARLPRLSGRNLRYKGVNAWGGVRQAEPSCQPADSTSGVAA